MIIVYKVWSCVWAVKRKQWCWANLYSLEITCSIYLICVMELMECKCGRIITNSFAHVTSFQVKEYVEYQFQNFLGKVNFQTATYLKVNFYIQMKMTYHKYIWHMKLYIEIGNTFDVWILHIRIRNTFGIYICFWVGIYYLACQMCFWF